MADFKTQWTSLLQRPGTQSVDFLASLAEEGINHYLEKHHQHDNRIYHREIKKQFNTHGDTRTFTVKLDIEAPLKLQFPPYKDATIAAQYINQEKWYQLDSEHEGPQITALQNEKNKIQVYCEKVMITLGWPKLSGEKPDWEFKLKPLQIFAEAFAVLNQDQDGHYVTLIPTVIKVDIDPKDHLQSLPIDHPGTSVPKLLDECQEKFTDLLVIAMNVLATEQAPRLVRNLRIPAPVIADRPIAPSLLDISANCLTIGAGIDQLKAQNMLQQRVNQELTSLQAALHQDIEAAGGLLSLVSHHKTELPKKFSDLHLKTEQEIERALVYTNTFLKMLEHKIKSANDDSKQKSSSAATDVKLAYGVAVNEYILDHFVSAVLPAPRHDCTGWLDLKFVRGKACYWIKFFQPDITINNDGSLAGAVNIDIGGALEACVRKFWDCSWRWECGHLSLALRGRPNITIGLIRSAGVRLSAKIGGDLHFETNLPFPFNKIIEALSKIMFKAIMAVINIVLSLLSFYVIRPQLEIPEQRTKIKLKDFDSFQFLRPAQPGLAPSKNNFLGITGGLVAEP